MRGERRDLFVRLFARLSAVAARNHVKAEEAAFKRSVEENCLARLLEAHRSEVSIQAVQPAKLAFRLSATCFIIDWMEADFGLDCSP